MLGTAEVTIIDKNGEGKTFRALCDNGSQVNLISQLAVKRLGLKQHKSLVQFTGIDGTPLGRSFAYVMATITLPDSQETLESKFYIMKKITNYSPGAWSDEIFAQDVNFADEKYNRAGNIDVLLGVGVWIRILKPRVMKNCEETIALQETKLGWVVFQVDNPNDMISVHMTGIKVQESTQEILAVMERFWKLEEIHEEEIAILCTEEQYCEDFYEKTHSRDETGRYIVRLPLKDEIKLLGRTKNGAKKIFEHMERKMAQDEVFATKYREFMREYIALGHMTKVENLIDEDGYFTPHHGIFASLKFCFFSCFTLHLKMCLVDLLMRCNSLDQNCNVIYLLSWLHFEWVCSD